MTKVLILSLLALLTVSMSTLPSHAQAARITHADFSYMSKAEQDKFIILMMDLMVELEGQHKKDVSAGQTHTEKFRTYSTLLKKLQNFFMADAVAAEEGWDKIASDYRRAITGKSDSVCIFAGWPSSMSNGKCTHPGKGANAGMYKGNCSGSNQVSCNPTIFGYQNKNSHSLFCVSTNDDAKNSALECKTKALAADPATGPESKKERLEYLRDRLTANPSVVNDIYSLSYKTCICDTSPIAMEKSYGTRIRPHRTCYGLIGMMAETAQVCEAPFTNNIKTSIFTAITSELQSQSINQKTDQFDNLYETTRIKIRDSQANKADVIAMCGVPAPAVMVGSNGPAATECKEDDDDEADTSSDETASNADSSADIVVTAPKCVATCPKAAAGTELDSASCKYKHNDKDEVPVDSKFTSDKKDSILAHFKNSLYRPKKCPPAKPANGTVDPASVDDQPETKPITCKVTTDKGDDSNLPKLVLKLSKKDLATQSNFTVKVTKTGGKDPAARSVAGSTPASNAGTATVKATDTAATITTEATSTEDGEITDAEISWFVKEKATTVAETETKTPTYTAPTETSEKPAPKPAKPAKPKESVVEKSIDGASGYEYTEDRREETVEVCAEATKVNFQKSEPDCKTVPKKIALIPGAGGMPGQGMQMRPMGTTIHQGIR